jgi:hypothetical protein
MLKFASMENGKGKYPRQTYDGQDNQSYNFVPANKLQTGNLRGTQGVGYGSVKIDGANNRIQISANDVLTNIGDISDLEDSTGIGLVTTEGNPYVILGKTNGTNSTTGLSVYDDAGTRRLLGGEYPDGTIKIKLSRPGYDVAVATDSQLIWSSDFNSPKILASGSVVINPADTGSPNYTVGIGQTTQTVTFDNPTGKTPMVLASFKASSTFTVGTIDVWTGTPQPVPFFLPGTPSVIISYDTPSTNSVRFQYAQFSSVNWGFDLSFTISYYIFVETSTL